MSRATALIEIGIKEMGSLQALANALQVNRTTVVRWDTGESSCSGTALVALMALIRHPEDFYRYKKNK